MSRASSSSVRADPLSGGDLMHWQADVGAAPNHVGALLLLGAPASGERLDAEAVADLFAARAASLPALARRPVPGTARGAGGWFWRADDEDPRGHVGVRVVPAAAVGEAALLQAAASLITERLPADRSPWSATVLTAADGEVGGLVLVAHHVLADGITGLSLLGALADPGVLPSPGDRGRPAGSADPARPMPGPTSRDPSPSRRSELGLGLAPAPATALNRPSGGLRRLHVAHLSEARVTAAARAHGASVNDLVLVAVADAFAAASAERGRRPGRVVVSIPVAVPAAERQRAHAGQAANSDGVMALSVPTTGALPSRVRAVTSVRRARSAGRRGRSLPLVLAGFRVIHRLGLTRWFLDHQRLANMLVTAVPPVPVRLGFGGAPVTGVIALLPGQGNMTVACATTRYAGTLTVAVMTDADAGPDGDRFAGHLAAVLDALTGPAT